MSSQTIVSRDAADSWTIWQQETLYDATTAAPRTKSPRETIEAMDVLFRESPGPLPHIDASRVQDASPNFGAYSNKQEITPLDVIPEKACVVYNRFNHESVIAAAIMKRHFPKCRFLVSGNRLPEDAEMYLWLDVEPRVDVFSSEGQAAVWKAEHRFFLSNHATQKVTTSMGQVVYSYLDDPEAPKTYVGDLPTSLIQRVINRFRPGEQKYIGLAYIAAEYFGRLCPLEDQAYVYHHYKLAEKSLGADGIPFEVCAKAACSVDEYLLAYKRVCAQVTRGHDLRTAKDSGSSWRARTKSELNAEHRVIVTCIEDDFFIARRIISWHYNFFANVVMSINGPQVHTNLATVKNLNLMDTITTLR